MQLVFADRKTKRIRVIPETLEDLWVLERAISPGDLVEGVVLRRVKREGERGSGEVFRIFVRIRVEEVKFHEYSGALRVSGIVIEARPEEYIGKGKHQSLEIRAGREVTIEKAEWEEHVIDEIKRAVEESKRPKITVVSMDDEGALVYVLSQRLERKGYVKNPHHGKRGEHSDLSEYYGQVYRFISELEPDLVIVGGPGFFYEDLIRFARAKGSEKRFVGVRTSMAGEKGIHEIISDKLEEVVRNHHLSEILRYVEEFRARLAKGEPVAVGDEVDVYAEAGAVEVLLMHENFFLSDRKRAHRILSSVRGAGGKIFIVPKDFEPAYMLEKMGGVVAILRYR